MQTLIVLPTYDEAGNIAEMLRRARVAVADADILVVDDASPDGTAAIARSVGAELGRIDVLVRAGKLGLGSAYRDGFARGLRLGHQILVEMDSDLSHDPAALPGLLRAVESGADLAIGSRYVAGGSIPHWPVFRRALSRLGNRYAALALSLPLADATSGFRAYRAATVAALDLRSVRADGYGFQIEMAYRVARAGGRIVELPIEFVDRRRGASKMSWRIVVEALALVMRLRWRDRTDRRRIAWPAAGEFGPGVADGRVDAVAPRPAARAAGQG